ncbi:glycosyltransferase [Aquincola tertiaricarbonis]|uniref:glycosyltransferase n=1 Tax=Aquincola tertiaricarbonis TaxID=391953 RepID=UPI000615136A|nr:glycosyltransferase [Aquincola tertiaricarbonis]
MKILRIISTMNPRGGGPSEGIRQVSQALARMGHTSECLTSDDPSAPWLAGQPVRIHAVGRRMPVGYAHNPAIGTWLRAHAQDYDAFVISGLWQHHSVAARAALRALGREYFVFTHGMLDPWFKQAYPRKHLKKWLYWPWGDYRVLRDARAVLFTSEEERLRARQSFWLYRARERVVAYGTRTPPRWDESPGQAAFLEAHPGLRGKRVMLFLSRIQQKKGCDLLIDAFAQVARTNADLRLVMAGPDQAAWRAALQQRAAALGIADRIVWPGMLQGDLKWGAFHAAEAFVLPSHQENFGIAVAEALGCGVPVLISDKVNIWREIEADGAGLVAPDTAEGTAQLLQRWLALSSAERAAMRDRARGCFAQRFTVEAMADSLLSVLQHG